MSDLEDIVKKGGNLLRRAFVSRGSCGRSFPSEVRNGSNASRRICRVTAYNAFKTGNST
jgi:hypothetical protein